MEASAAASEQGSRSRGSAILLSIFLIALCGLIYELLLGTVATYVLGDSVKQFSITIGFFLSAMGLGSFLSRYVRQNLMERFLEIELFIAGFGGFSAILLFGIYAYVRVLFRPCLYGTLIGLGTCIGLEIPILTRVLKRFGTLRTVLAEALSMDYIGALVASLAFPLLLYPYLGLMRTALLTGAVNLAVVVLNMRCFRDQVVNAKRIWVCTLLLLAGLGAAFIYATWITGRLEEKIFRAPVIWAVRSPYQKCVLTKRGDDPGDLRMWINGKLQFSSLDEHRYHEALVHPAMTLSADPTHVLILGGGDGLAVREVLKYGEVEQVVVVDIDPGITHLSRNHPAMREITQDAMNDPRVEIVHRDAFVFLEEDPRPFGVILVDLPDPDCIELARLYSVESFKLMGFRLKEGGALSVQSSSPTFCPRAYWCIETTIRAAGLFTQPYHNYVPTFGSWGYVLASNRSLSVDALEIQVPTKYLDAAAARDLFRFPPDMPRVDVKVNRRFQPVVLRYYERDWKKWFPL